MANTTIPEPQQGGSYTREADGSLTLVESTAERPMVDKRKKPTGQATAPAAAPADEE